MLVLPPEEEVKTLRSAYMEAENYPDRQKTIECWSALDSVN